MPVAPNPYTGASCDECSDPHYAQPECTSCLPTYTGASCDECAAKYTGASCDECAAKYTGASCDECADPKYTGAIAPSPGQGAWRVDSDAPCGVSWSQELEYVPGALESWGIEVKPDALLPPIVTGGEVTVEAPEPEPESEGQGVTAGVGAGINTLLCKEDPETGECNIRWAAIAAVALALYVVTS